MKHKRYRVDLIKVNQSTGKKKHAPVIKCLILFCILPLKKKALKELNIDDSLIHCH